MDDLSRRQKYGAAAAGPCLPEWSSLADKVIMEALLLI